MLVNFFPETRNLKKCQRLLDTNLFFFILDFLPPALYNRCVVRRVAQFGRALRSGRRGRGFESRHADIHIHKVIQSLYSEVGSLFSLFLLIFTPDTIIHFLIRTSCIFRTHNNTFVFRIYNFTLSYFTNFDLSRPMLGFQRIRSSG